ncbi:CHE group protein [Dictyostelium discoideum AX4]|uniref:CHE group protein n=1 Tax=Dictyostelium discoideum TaxID=44689 RepID=Q54WV6_DICDI|nr:CHE group protein [Dictyostelium discoideum AX4]EAL67835.2 CHE group protein [Dictyostelium discoideum AX4]|eukprot:XP_641825.2 CHE group protein [Dictyostelium discoideum AX4]
MQDISDSNDEDINKNNTTTTTTTSSTNIQSNLTPLSSRRRRTPTVTTPPTKQKGGYPKEEQDEEFDEDVDIEEEEEEEDISSEPSEDDDDDEDYDDGGSKRKRKSKKQKQQEEEEEAAVAAASAATSNRNIIFDENGNEIYEDEGDDEGDEEEDEEEDEEMDEEGDEEEDEEDDEDEGEERLEDLDSSDSSDVEDTTLLDQSQQTQQTQHQQLQQQLLLQQTQQQLQQHHHQIQDGDKLFQSGDPGDDFLIPIRLDIQSSVYKIGDYLLWNLNERDISPEYYSKRLCIELDYPEWFEFMITNSIANQIIYGKSIIKEFRKILPKLKQIFKECIVTISLDLNVNGLYLKDRFEWDIIGPNLPESFAKSISMDLGLSREFENIIVYSIREQIQTHYSQITQQYNLNPNGFRYYSSMRNQPIHHDQILRNDYQLTYFTPTISYRQPPKVGGYDPPTAYFIQQNHLRQQTLQQQQQLKYQLRTSTIQQQQHQQHPQQFVR